MTQPASQPGSQPSNTATPSGPRRIGRRIGQGLYYALVVGVAGAAIWQVTAQVFFPDSPAEPAPYASCEEGLRQLLAAVDRARRAAERDGQPLDGAREEAALMRYRAAITPSWRHRDAVDRMCKGTEYDGLLDAIERLRYSEEHSVRHQAAELSALRARVHDIVAKKVPR